MCARPELVLPWRRAILPAGPGSLSVSAISSVSICFCLDECEHSIWQKRFLNEKGVKPAAHTPGLLVWILQSGRHGGTDRLVPSSLCPFFPFPQSCSSGAS